MLSPQSQSHNSGLQDCSFEEECLDDIKPELISFTLSSSDTSALSFDDKSPKNEKSTLKISCDNCSEGESSSDSFLLILSTLSGKDEFSSTETLITHDDIKPLCPKHASTLEDCDKSGTILSAHLNVNDNRDVEDKVQYSSRTENKGKRLAVSRTKLSSSMHDVSKFPDFPLKQKSKIYSSDIVESQSMTTISTGVKSKDSGIPRSLSCLSLNSGSRNYDHVQSKVKEYIRQIKEKEENRKIKKLENSAMTCNNGDSLNCNCNLNLPSITEKSLTTLVHDLQYQLDNKDAVISKLQESYDKLLTKYAAAENRIDQLRFKIIDSSLETSSRNVSKEDLTKLTFPFDFNERDIVRSSNIKIWRNLHRRSSTAEMELHNPAEINKLEHSVLSKENFFSPIASDTRKSLSPVIGLYSSSSRLDGKLEPLTSTARSRSHDDSTFTTSVQQLHLVPNSKISNKQTKEFKSVRHTLTSNRNLSKEVVDNAVKSNTFENYPREECEWNSKMLNNSSQAIFPHQLSCKNEALHSTSENDKISLQPKTLFSDVAAWQEDLPPLGKAEQSCYGSFDCDSNKNKALSRSTKKFVSPCDRDSGCPASELYNSSLQPSPFRASVSERTKCDVDVTSETNLKAVTLPVLSTCKKPPFRPPVSAIYTMQSNSSLTSQLPTVETKIAGAGSSRSVVLQSPADINDINECECWWFDQSSNRSKDSDITCAQQQEFNVPPLILGSLLNDSINGDSISNSDASKLTEGELNSLTSTINDENLTTSEKGTTEDITYPSSTVLTSCASTNMTENDRTNSNHNHTCQSFPVTLKKHTTVNKRVDYLTSEHVFDNESLLPSYTPTSYKSIQPYIENVEKKSILENNGRKQDSLLASTSTSYESIQPYTKVLEKMTSKTPTPPAAAAAATNTTTTTSSTTSNKNVYISKDIVEKLMFAVKNRQKNLTDISACTKNDGKYHCKYQENKITTGSHKTQGQDSATVKQTSDAQESCRAPNLETSDSSPQHRKKRSDVSASKIVDVALKVLLIHFFKCTEKCNRSGCICNRLTAKKVASVTAQTQTDQVSLKKNLKKKTVSSRSTAVSDKHTGASVEVNFKNASKSKTLVDLEGEIQDERMVDSASQKSNSNNTNINKQAFSDSIEKRVLEYSNKAIISSTNLTKRELNVADNVENIKFIRSTDYRLEHASVEKENVLTRCVEEMDNIALQLRESSEKILSALSVLQKHGS